MDDLARDPSMREEDGLLRASLLRFGKKELDCDMVGRDRDGEFSRESWSKCAGMGIQGLLIPKEYGGSGFDLPSGLIGLEALSYSTRDNGIVHAMVPQMCCGVQLLLFGSEPMKRRYLPDIAQGRKVCAQAITEPDAGSDVGGMKTRYEKTDSMVRITGTKTFVSNAPIADIVVVYAAARTHEKGPHAISCFLVESGTPGLWRGKPLEKMGLRTLLNGDLVFDGCGIPLEQIVGRERQGFFMLNETMEWERLLMGAVHLGVMQRVMEKTIQYAKERTQFGSPIGKYQAVSHRIADMKVSIELGRAILYKAGRLKAELQRAPLEASIAKVHLSESLKRICMDAVQIHGAYGYSKEFELERELRDSIAGTVYSGTSEIQRNIISRFLGL
jgi:alkylation response protein AidB-like acyl-CoA dehydrogenase